jgi:hypothetical protein
MVAPEPLAVRLTRLRRLADDGFASFSDWQKGTKTMSNELSHDLSQIGRKGGERSASKAGKKARAPQLKAAQSKKADAA